MNGDWKAFAKAGGIDSSVLTEWLREQEQRGSVVSVGFPGASRAAAKRWLGRRLVCWPHGIPAGRRVGLVSSRLGQALDKQDAWFAVLRAACAKIDAQRDLLITARSTTTDRFVRRCGELFGIRVLCFDFARRGESFERWFTRVREHLPVDPSCPVVCVSPELREPVAAGNQREQCTEAAGRRLAALQLGDGVASHPLRDRAIVALSDCLIVLQVRRGGHQHELVRARLADDAWPAGSVYVAIAGKLTRPDVAKELLSSGAVGWVGVGHPATEQGPGASERSTSVWSAPMIPVPPAENWRFLTHWTCRRAGPWPRQDERDFVDDLVFGRDDSDHSVLAALSRIVVRQHLMATADAIRGQTSVVSFTAVPLADIARQRVFRPHRSRWDFEGYGICIRSDWLVQRGAAAVCYGGDDLWNQLPESQRPFFQQWATRSGQAGSRIDWKTEQEWRHVGDVDLSQLPADAGLLFVPTRKEAAQIAPLSRWPIVVLQQP